MRDEGDRIFVQDLVAGAAAIWQLRDGSWYPFRFFLR
jgi:hypothetical protein